jgi:hypothetical protein
MVDRSRNRFVERIAPEVKEPNDEEDLLPP